MCPNGKSASISGPKFRAQSAGGHRRARPRFRQATENIYDGLTHDDTVTTIPVMGVSRRILLFSKRKCLQKPPADAMTMLCAPFRKATLNFPLAPLPERQRRKAVAACFAVSAGFTNRF